MMRALAGPARDVAARTGWVLDLAVGAVVAALLVLITGRLHTGGGRAVDERWTRSRRDVTG
jgi:hypothetical protein